MISRWLPTLLVALSCGPLRLLCYRVVHDSEAPQEKLTLVSRKPGGMKLNKCEGDCMSDANCTAGLKCYHRPKGRGDELVPGCKGRVPWGDYCHDPHDAVAQTRQLNKTQTAKPNSSQSSQQTAASVQRSATSNTSLAAAGSATIAAVSANTTTKSQKAGKTEQSPPARGKPKARGRLSRPAASKPAKQNKLSHEQVQPKISIAKERRSTPSAESLNATILPTQSRKNTSATLLGRKDNKSRGKPKRKPQTKSNELDLFGPELEEQGDDESNDYDEHEEDKHVVDGDKDGTGPKEELGPEDFKVDVCKKALQDMAQGDAKDSAVVLANPSSGGNQGEKMLKMLEDKSINTWGISSVPLPPKGDSKDKIKQVLADGWGKNGGPSRARIICAGGDGTAAWCLSIIANIILKMGGGGDKDNPDYAAAVAMKIDGFEQLLPTLVMCPLGTGNDFSRSIGWGRTFPGNAQTQAQAKKNMKNWLSNVMTGTAFTRFDIWRLAFKSGKGCKSTEEFFQPKLEPGKFVLMFLYMSIGHTALAAAAFERTSSQTRNTLLHGANGVTTLGTMGRKDFGIRCPVGCTKKNPKLKVGADLGVFNVPSFLGGKMHPWQNSSVWRSSFKAQMVYDKKVEVATRSSPLSTGFSIIGAVRSQRFGQTDKISLTWDSREFGPEKPKAGETRGRYIQVDGEAFQCGGEGGVEITHGGQLVVQVGPDQDPAAKGSTEEAPTRSGLFGGGPAITHQSKVAPRGKATIQRKSSLRLIPKLSSR